MLPSLNEVLLLLLSLLSLLLLLLLSSHGVGPCHFSVVYCNYALYKKDTSLRRTTETLETVNGHLRSEFCSEKQFKTEIWVLYMTRNCKICNSLQSFSSLQSVYSYAFRPQSRERLIVQQEENDSTFLLRCSSFSCFA